jgi:very-short-patch-repair endonuclease
MSAHEVIVRALSNEIGGLAAYYTEKLTPLCQSPLEVIFGAVMTFVLRQSRPQGLVCCIPSDEEKYSECQYLLMPQYPWFGYRIDWAIKIKGAKRPFVFIELDGHDFHERTKEQAARDRAKDRAIQSADITVFRFTGSELYRDPGGCVWQVMKLLYAREEQEVGQ